MHVIVANRLRWTVFMPVSILVSILSGVIRRCRDRMFSGVLGLVVLLLLV